MEYVYAALILNATGKEVTEEGVTSVLNAAGATVNEVRAKALIAALEGIDIEEAISTAAFAGAPAAADRWPQRPPRRKKKQKQKQKRRRRRRKRRKKKRAWKD